MEAPHKKGGCGLVKEVWLLYLFLITTMFSVFLKEDIKVSDVRAKLVYSLTF